MLADAGRANCGVEGVEDKVHLSLGRVHARGLTAVDWAAAVGEQSMGSRKRCQCNCCAKQSDWSRASKFSISSSRSSRPYSCTRKSENAHALGAISCHQFSVPSSLQLHSAAPSSHFGRWVNTNVEKGNSDLIGFGLIDLTVEVDVHLQRDPNPGDVSMLTCRLPRCISKTRTVPEHSTSTVSRTKHMS